MPKLALFLFAGVSAFFAIGMWYAFLRPAKTTSTVGTIVSKTHKPAGEHFQYPGGLNRDSFYGPNRIPTAEGYVLVIHVELLAANVGYFANIPEADNYEVGQSVSLRYQVRGIPGLWRRVYVVGLSR